MKTINYKGFTLEVEIDDKLLIKNVEGSLTNQVALLTGALCKNNDRVNLFITTLDYTYTENGNEVDFAIDIDKWLLINPSMQQRVLIELLMLEEEEIKEQLVEVV